MVSNHPHIYSERNLDACAVFNLINSSATTAHDDISRDDLTERKYVSVLVYPERGLSCCSLVSSAAKVSTTTNLNVYVHNLC